MHMICMPPSILVIVILQRGVIIMFGIMPMPPIPGIIMLPIPISRPVIIVVMVIILVSQSRF